MRASATCRSTVFEFLLEIGHEVSSRVALGGEFSRGRDGGSVFCA
jgi:hypothetical protein